jgi:ABC-type multidrug transport system ATPase subunit
MSENLLKALVQLFAIITTTEGVTSNRRRIVEILLSQQLSPTLGKHYLASFDEQVTALSEKRKSAKVSVNNSVRVIKICTEINKELTQKQKAYVLIRLLELISAEGTLAENDTEFVDTVASAFNFDTDEYNSLKTFICDNPLSLSIPELIIIGDKTAENPPAKHILRDNINTPICVLYISSVSLYVLRHFELEDVTLNGQLIATKTTHILSQGAVIKSSRFATVYYTEITNAFLQDTYFDNINFTVKNITHTFSSGKQALHPLSFSEASGKMIGIMGASGAGKSTLLNILNGNEKPSTGNVFANGMDIHANSTVTKSLIGYVSQDDLLLEDLTVYENLYYSSRLSLGNLSLQIIEKRILHLLDALGLLNVKDIKVGSPLNKRISGGQRKRLNIALELIREPAILFVDEPTSGLSSRDSENIMDMLKELAQRGKLVFVVIHQPSSEIFKLFDKLLILDTGGYPVYYGSSIDSVSYFKQQINQANSSESECPSCGNVNPESIFAILETKILDEYGNQTKERKLSPFQWNQHYTADANTLITDIPSKSDIPTAGSNRPNLLQQFKLFFLRDVLNKLANKQYLLINLLEAPLLAFILAFTLRMNTNGVYNFRLNENIPIYLFMSVVVALFMGMMVSAEELFKDRKLLKREQFLSLSRFSYLNAKISVLFILSAIQMLIFVVIGNTLLGLNSLHFAYWITLFSVCCFANLLGLIVSSAFNSAVTIYIVIPLLLIPQLLLSGVMIKFDKLHPMLISEDSTPVVGNLMTSRWAFEALAINQMTNNKYDSRFYKFDSNMGEANYKKDYWIPEVKKQLEDYTKNPSHKDLLPLIVNEWSKELTTGLGHKILQKPISLSDDINGQSANILQKLDKLASAYSDKFNDNSAKKEKLIASYSSPQAKASLIVDNNLYSSKALNSLALNDQSLDKIKTHNTTLSPIANVPYLEPMAGNYPLYTAEKQLFGVWMNTLSYNTIIIWFMTLVLYLVLFFELPAKLTKLKS